MASEVKFSRPPLQRMVRIHAALQGGDFPNCSKLGRVLEVSTKTVQRDIEFMRDRLELPIEYDQKQFGYHYTQPVTHFPGIEVSEGEIVALFVAQKALLQYQGTVYEKPLQAAFRKLTDGLDDKITFAWSDLDSAVSFRNIGQSVSDLALFETVSKAVLRSEELEFAYKKLKSDKYEERRVQPYHLGCVEQQWYLFALDLGRKQMRTLALPRMKKARLTKKEFQRPADFSIAEHLSGSFGVFSGREKQRVVIEFDEFAARLVSERQWHDSQVIEELPASGLRLTLELGSLEEIERWVLSWGAHAEVLEPPALRESLTTAASALLKQYRPADL